MNQQQPARTGSPEGRNIQPVPPEPAPVPPEPAAAETQESPRGIPYAYRDGRLIIIENGASIPTGYCIKSGRPAKKRVEVSLRNPSNPLTWFGKRPKVEVGLSKKHHENYVVAVALTWSTMAVGALLLVAGALTISLLSCLVGVIAIGVSGVFRATSPVTSADATEEYATIAGAGETYLKLLRDGSGEIH